MPADFVSPLFEVSYDDVAVLVVEAHDAGSGLVVQVQQVEEVDALLLYVIVLAQLIVNPLETGEVTLDDIVVVDVAGLGDDAEEGAQLRPPVG